MPKSAPSPLKTLRLLALAGVAAVAISACASNRASVTAPDFSSLTAEQSQENVAKWAEAYQRRPSVKRNAIYYAAALRAAGQPGQAVAVLQQATLNLPNDVEITIAYAKALAAEGKFTQALTIIDGAIRSDSPDWMALNVKGAILDQMGRNSEARAIYSQALLIAPNQAAIHANLGLSFAMSGDLETAETHLRNAVAAHGATSQIRQNLALVVGLQGRFDEARELFAAELPPEQVEANMAYVRALLTQQDRWNLIAGDN